MMRNPFHIKTLNFQILNILGWLAYFFIYLYSISFHYDVARPKVIVWSFLVMVNGFLLSFILRFIYHRINHRVISFIKLASLVILVSLALSITWYLTDQVLDLIMKDPDIKPVEVNLSNFFVTVFINCILFSSWSSLYFIIKLRSEAEEESFNAIKADKIAHSAQLQILRYKLNPNFLFNSLGTIRALIDIDEITAKRLITDLSEFLRYSLENQNHQEVPLSREIEAIEKFCSIEKLRYEDKIEISFNINKETEDVPVLSFIIYPLVEYAFRNENIIKNEKISICITTFIKDDNLFIQIKTSSVMINKDKVSLSNETPELYNLEQKLKDFYKDNFGIRIIPGDDYVTISIMLKLNHLFKEENIE